MDIFKVFLSDIYVTVYEKCILYKLFNLSNLTLFVKDDHCLTDGLIHRTLTSKLLNSIKQELTITKTRLINRVDLSNSILVIYTCICGTRHTRIDEVWQNTIRRKLTILVVVIPYTQENILVCREVEVIRLEKRNNLREELNVLLKEIETTALGVVADVVGHIV